MGLLPAPADTTYVSAIDILTDGPVSDTRRLLLEAALETFAAGGYEATTVDALAAAAGFTKGAYYVHFSDKEAVLVALFDAWAGRRRGEWLGLTEALAAGPEALIQALTGFLYREAADSRWRALELEIRAQAARLPALGSRLAAVEEEWRQALTATFGPSLAAAILELRAGLVAVSVVRGPLAEADARRLVLRLLEVAGPSAPP